MNSNRDASTSLTGGRKLAVLLACIVGPPLVLGGLYVATRGHRDAMDVAWREYRAVGVVTRPATNPERLAVGEQVYRQYCVSCHATDGNGGTVGPALHGTPWRNEHAFDALFNTVAHGRPGTAMMAWRKTLLPDQVHAVSSYVWSLEERSR